MDKFEPEFFSFDKHKLDEELQSQPKMYFEHAVLLADARRDYEQAEAAKDLVWAELDRDIRSDPAAFGIDKITEPTVKEAITRSKRYQRAVADAIDKKHDMDVMQAGTTALDHRKRGLEKAVELYLSDYWAEPRIKGDGREKAREDNKKQTRTAGQRKRAERDDYD